MVKNEGFKTASIGGYDKKSVDNYLSELTVEHESEVEDLTEQINNLNKTINELQMVKATLVSRVTEAEESTKELKEYSDSLKGQNEEFRNELAELKARERSYSDKTESISKTLIEARMHADSMISEAKKQSDELIKKAEEDRNSIRTKTEDECKRMLSKTDEDRKKLLSDAKIESDRLVNNARQEALNVRNGIQHECGNINAYMNSLMDSIEGVITACQNTKKISAEAFKGVPQGKKSDNLMNQQKPEEAAKQQSQRPVDDVNGEKTEPAVNTKMAEPKA